MTTPSPQERMAQLRQAIDDYPQQVARLQEQIAERAGQFVTGENEDGTVSVTVTAAGVVEEVRVTRRALHMLDNHTLAAHVTAAVNDALDRAERLLTGGDVAEGSGADDALAQFERRMDDLYYQLDRLDRRLDQLND